jgi:hypothetical protein
MFGLYRRGMDGHATTELEEKHGRARTWIEISPLHMIIPVEYEKCETRKGAQDQL